MTTKIVTSDQMRTIEARSEQAGVSTDTLMEQAGLEVARRVRHHLGYLMGVPVVVLVGPGNNGGDGLVTARQLGNWGARVLVYLCTDRKGPDPKLDIVRNQRISIVKAAEDEGLQQLKKSLASAHLVVDAVLGTGRARPIGGTLKSILLELAKAKDTYRRLRILALDIPTGLDADTGALDPVCPAADVTVALGYPKVGLYTFPGADRVAALEVVDIGIPDGLDGDIPLELMTPSWACRALPCRPLAAHKGSFGRTLVVAGSRSYIGAAYLAASAATRAGAGLVTVAIPESLQLAVAAKATEPTYLPLPESSPGVLSPKAAATVLESLAGYDALLIGCGIGQAHATKQLVEQLLFSDVLLPPTVVDADGLNILAMSQTGAQSWWERFPSNAIVTPHPGEMARLAGQSTESIQDDRLVTATKSARLWNKVTVLKGAYTVVAFSDGRAMLSPFANPALASAGTGDVLAGIIAGLLSQGLAPEAAAALGVYLHGAAGEHVRSELGNTGLVASDLLDALPRVIKMVSGMTSGSSVGNPG